MFKRVIPLLLALTLMLGLGAYWLLYYTGNNTEFAKGHRYLVTIKPGMTTADIADLLHKKHLVKTPEAFRMEARLRGLAGKLEAGRYEIVGGMSNSEIVSILSKGQTYNVKFTVPEGFNVVKTGRKLEAEGLGDAKKFEEAARNYTPYPYMETKNPDVIFKAEGFIFPTTYQLDSDMTEKDILALMVRTFNSEMNRENIPALAREKNMNLRDLINLAAMVELEAVYPEEQARIAGVFLKRLHIYFREMYPIIPRLLLGGIIFFEIYFIILLNNGITKFDLGIQEFVGMYTIFAFLLWLSLISSACSSLSSFSCASRCCSSRIS